MKIVIKVIAAILAIIYFIFARFNDFIIILLFTGCFAFYKHFAGIPAMLSTTELLLISIIFLLMRLMSKMDKQYSLILGFASFHKIMMEKLNGPLTKQDIENGTKINVSQTN